MTDVHESTRAAPGAEEKRRRLAELLGRRAGGRRQRIGPTSFAQRRQWIFDQLAPESSEYNVWIALRAEQELDPAALGAALGEVVRRHEVLRTVFPDLGGTPVQEVREPFPVDVPLHDVSGEPDPERTALRLAAEEAGRRFDLASGPLLRARLYHLGPGDQLLLLAAHHIIFDGWSAGVLFRELDAGYTAFREGRRPDLPDLPLQYLDYAVWTRQELGPLEERQIDYWRNALRGAPEFLRLPQDYSRPPVRDVRGGSEPATLPAPLVRELERLGSAEGASPFAVLLAGFAALLGRYAGQTDVSVGVPVSGRTRPELEHLIGFFVNTLVLRLDVGGNPGFRELVRRVQEVTVGAFANQDVPFERLVEVLRPERDPALSPLFQVLYNLQVSPPDRLRLPGLRARLQPVDSGVVRFDLELNLFQLEGEVRGTWNYRQAVFHQASVARMTGHYRRLLEGAAAAPDRGVLELPILGDGERRWLLGGAVQRPAGFEPVAARIASQAALTPGAAAVEAPGARLSYRDLAARVAALADRLREAGVGPETVVGVCLERTPDLPVALLAVLRAGGAALPVSPESWPDWGPDALEAAGATHLLCRDLPQPSPPAGVTALAPDAVEPAGAPPVPPAPESAALLLFRADPRGEPLGEVVDQAALTARLDGLCERYDLAPGEGVLGVAPASTEAGVWQLLWPLAAGGRVVLPDPGRRLDAAHLAGVAAERGAGTVWAAPTLLRELLGSGLAGAGLRRVICASEPLSTELVQRVRAELPDVALHNAYAAPATGPAADWPADDTARLGRAPVGTSGSRLRAHVVDGWLEPVPPGVTGELCAGGPQLARGYVGRPALTAERFVPDPDGPPGGRRHRTDDVARRRRDGQLELLGRAGAQPAVRGVVVEVGEIEEVLAAHPAVAAAVVRGAGPGGAGSRLTAHLLRRRDPGAAGQPEDPAEVLTAVGTHARWLLPADLVPASLSLLDRFPLAPDGSLDRAALPAAAPLAARAERAEPSTDLERAVAGIWGDLLHREGIGAHESFFELGGTSLLAIQVAGQVASRLGIELRAAELFRYRTVADLALRLAELRESPAGRGSRLVRLRTGRHRPAVALVHPVGGGSLCYGPLAAALEDRTVYAFEARDPAVWLEEIASGYVDELLEAEPEADLRLGGWSLGGVVGYEVARQLAGRTGRRAPVVVIDSFFATLPREEVEHSEPRLLTAFVQHLLGEAGAPEVQAPEVPSDMAVDRALLLAVDQLRTRVALPALDPAELLVRYDLYRRLVLAVSGYRPGPYDGPLTVVEATESEPSAAAWLALCPAAAVVRVPGGHLDMVREPAASRIARLLES